MPKGRGGAGRVFLHYDGSALAQALTGTWTNGGSVQVEAATHFSPDGGDGVFKDSLDSETGEAFSYQGIEINGSDNPSAPDLLLGVTRDNPVSHAKGTWVQEGSTPTIEKRADVYVDGSEVPFPGVPVDPAYFTYLKQGTFDADERPMVSVDFDEEGNVLVVGAPEGVIPLVGADTETLPGTGDGDGTVDPDTGNPPPGMGWEDGAPPSTAPVLTAVGGVGFISLRASAIENNSAVTYKFYGHTSAGFTEDETTFIGSVRLSGEAGFLPSLTVKDFPTGHVLDGGANDPVKAGVTYRFTCVPYDGSGAGPTSNEVSVSPVNVGTVDIDTGAVTEALLAANAVTETKIANDSVTSPKIVARTIQAGDIATGTITANEIAADTITANEIAANAITTNEIAANTIVAGDIASGTITATQIASSTITADKLSVSTLSAITANLGTITAGTLSAVTVTGGTIQTATTGRNIAITGSNTDSILFRDGTTTAATITYAAGTALLLDSTGAITISGDSQVNVLSDADDVFISAQLDITLEADDDVFIKAFAGKVSLQPSTMVEVVGKVAWSDPPQWSDGTNDVKTNPGISNGSGEAIPGTSGASTPDTWFRVQASGGGFYWIPAFN